MSANLIVDLIPTGEVPPNHPIRVPNPVQSKSKGENVSVTSLNTTKDLEVLPTPDDENPLNKTKDNALSPNPELNKTQSETADRVPEITDNDPVEAANGTFVRDDKDEIGIGMASCTEGAFFSCSNSFSIDSSPPQSKIEFSPVEGMSHEHPHRKANIPRSSIIQRRSLLRNTQTSSPSTLIFAFENLNIASPKINDTFESMIECDSFKEVSPIAVPESKIESPKQTLNLVSKKLESLLSEHEKSVSIMKNEEVTKGETIQKSDSEPLEPIIQKSTDYEQKNTGNEVSPKTGRDSLRNLTESDAPANILSLENSMTSNALPQEPVKIEEQKSEFLDFIREQDETIKNVLSRKDCSKSEELYKFDCKEQSSKHWSSQSNHFSKLFPKKVSEHPLNTERAPPPAVEDSIEPTKDQEQQIPGIEDAKMETVASEESVENVANETITFSDLESESVNPEDQKADFLQTRKKTTEGDETFSKGVKEVFGEDYEKQVLKAEDEDKAEEEKVTYVAVPELEDQSSKLTEQKTTILIESVVKAPIGEDQHKQHIQEVEGAKISSEEFVENVANKTIVLNDLERQSFHSEEHKVEALQEQNKTIEGDETFPNTVKEVFDEDHEKQVLTAKDSDETVVITEEEKPLFNVVIPKLEDESSEFAKQKNTTLIDDTVKEPTGEDQHKQHILEVEDAKIMVSLEGSVKNVADKTIVLNDSERHSFKSEDPKVESLQEQKNTTESDEIFSKVVKEVFGEDHEKQILKPDHADQTVIITEGEKALTDVAVPELEDHSFKLAERKDATLIDGTIKEPTGEDQRQLQILEMEDAERMVVSSEESLENVADITIVLNELERETCNAGDQKIDLLQEQKKTTEGDESFSKAVKEVFGEDHENQVLKVEDADKTVVKLAVQKPATPIDGDVKEPTGEDQHQLQITEVKDAGMEIVFSTEFFENVTNKTIVNDLEPQNLNSEDQRVSLKTEPVQEQKKEATKEHQEKLVLEDALLKEMTEENESCTFVGEQKELLENVFSPIGELIQNEIVNINPCNSDPMEVDSLFKEAKISSPDTKECQEQKTVEDVTAVEKPADPVKAEASPKSPQKVETMEAGKTVVENSQKEASSGVFKFVQKIGSLVFPSKTPDATPPKPMKENQDLVSTRDSDVEKTSQDVPVDMETEMDKEIAKICAEIRSEVDTMSDNDEVFSIELADEVGISSLKSEEAIPAVDSTFAKLETKDQNFEIEVICVSDPVTKTYTEFVEKESECAGVLGDENLDRELGDVLKPLSRRRRSSGVIMTSMDFASTPPQLRYIEKQFLDEPELPGYDKYLELKLEINRLQQAVATSYLEIKQKEAQILELCPNKLKVELDRKQFIQKFEKTEKPPTETKNEVSEQLFRAEERIKQLETEAKKLREELSAKTEDYTKLQQFALEVDIVLDQYKNKLDDTTSALKREKEMSKKLSANLQKVISSYENYKKVALALQSNEIVYKEGIEKLKADNHKLRENYRTVLEQMAEANKENQRLETTVKAAQMKYPSKRN